MSVSIQSFEHGASEAEAIARRLGISYDSIRVHRFPDGESLVTVAPPAPVTILYCSLDWPNARLVELMLAVEALRRNGARRLVLVAPYLCYMRQDKAFHPGEAISQHAMGRWLGGMFDRIVTVDAHLHRVSDLSAVFPGIEAENLSAAESIAAFVKEKNLPPSTLVAGPDSESGQWVSMIARTLGCEAVTGRKRRLGDRKVEIEFPGGPLDGRTVLFADDIVSSGGTMTAAIRALKQAGAGDIYVAITHALFDNEAEVAMHAAGARAIWSTTSVPHPTSAITLDALFAGALRRETARQGD